MATQTGDDIAELRALLQACCDQVAGLSDAAFLGSVEGSAPPVLPPQTPAAAAVASALPGAESGGAAVSAAAILAGEAGPRWRPLLVGLPPGVKELVAIVKPPLNILVALLQVIAAFVEIIKALLIGIPDPFEALILAAYHALQAIINDILNTGAYMYYDAPGFTSHEISLAELGLDPEPKKQFNAGEKGDPAPTRPVDGFQRWAGRFAASFDDPGDKARPILSDGASVEAVFIVAAAPTLEALSQLIWLLGNLLNIDAFKLAFERFNKDAADPAKSRVDQQSVAPDWHSKKLPDLIPPLSELAKIPELLLGLLLKLQNVLDLLADLANAIQEKVQLLLSIAEMIEEIIALLDALQSAGLYILPVATNEGVEGLKRSFVEAGDRPDGGYLAGICFLAAGPGLKDAAFLWEMLTGGAFEEAAKEVADLAKEAGKELGAVAEDFGESAEESWKEMHEAVENLPQDTLDSLGAAKEDLLDALQNAPNELGEILEDAKEVHVNDAIRKGKEKADKLKGRGERSLAMYLGHQPRGGGPGRVSPEDIEDLPTPEDFEPPEKP